MLVPAGILDVTQHRSMAVERPCTALLANIYHLIAALPNQGLIIGSGGLAVRLIVASDLGRKSVSGHGKSS